MAIAWQRVGLRNLEARDTDELQPRSKFGSQAFLGLPYVPGRWGKTSLRLRGQSLLACQLPWLTLVCLAATQLDCLGAHTGEHTGTAAQVDGSTSGSEDILEWGWIYITSFSEFCSCMHCVITSGSNLDLCVGCFWSYFKLPGSHHGSIWHLWYLDSSVS